MGLRDTGSVEGSVREEVGESSGSPSSLPPELASVPVSPARRRARGRLYAMVPPIHGHTIPTLGIPWVLLALGASVLGTVIIGTRTFYKRVVS